MPTTIDGSTGCSKAQDGSIVQADLADGVVGKGICFSAYLGTAQPISGGGFTKVNINTEQFDTHNNFDTTTGRFTPTVAGYYLIVGGIETSSASALARSFAAIYKNGGNIRQGSDAQPISGAFLTQSVVTALVYMNGTTDYLELYAYASGASPTLSSGSVSTVLQGHLVRAA